MIIATAVGLRAARDERAFDGPTEAEKGRKRELGGKGGAMIGKASETKNKLAQQKGPLGRF